MKDKIEEISDQRRGGLIALGFSFIILQVIHNKSEALLPWISHVMNVVLVVLAYIGLSIVFQRGRYKSKYIEHALEDELVKSNRSLACRYAFLAMISVAALLCLITPFWDISGYLIARTLLTVGVVTPMFVFAYLDRPDA